MRLHFGVHCRVWSGARLGVVYVSYVVGSEDDDRVAETTQRDPDSMKAWSPRTTR